MIYCTIYRSNYEKIKIALEERVTLKKFRWLIALLVLFVSWECFAVSFYYIEVQSDNRVEGWKMSTSVILNDPTSPTVSYSVDGGSSNPMSLFTEWGTYYQNIYTGNVTDQLGGTPTDYEGSEFTWSVDDMNNLSATGTIQGVRQVSLSTGFSVSGDPYHPTLSWTNTDTSLDAYRVRILNSSGQLVWQSTDFAYTPNPTFTIPNDSSGFTFQIGVEYVFRIEAREFLYFPFLGGSDVPTLDPYLRLMNRSAIFEPYTIDAPLSIIESITAGDLNNDGSDDLAGVSTSDQVQYSTNLATWTNITGELQSIVTGDYNGDGNDDIAGVNSIGQVWYTTDLSSWKNIPGTVAAIVTGDLDGDGDDDIAGINPAGMISKIFYTTDLSTWTPIPGLITSIVTGDLDGDGDDDIAGINPDGMISKIFYTTDLSTWTPIPGLITSIVAGDFDGDGDDDIAGINPNGVSAKIFYTNDLVNWNIVPGALVMITTGDLNADGTDDIAGVSSSGMTWYTTDLATWTNIP